MAENISGVRFRMRKEEVLPTINFRPQTDSGREAFSHDKLGRVPLPYIRSLSLCCQ